jgi:hypothetical protein
VEIPYYRLIVSCIVKHQFIILLKLTMGCEISRLELEGIEVPLDPVMEITHLEEVDKALIDASKVITIIEELRNAVVDEFDRLAVSTGAIAYKHPDLEKCIISFLYVAEKEHEGFITSIQSLNEAPFIKIDNDKLTQKTKKIFHKLENFIKNLINLRSLWDENKINETRLLKEKLMSSENEYVEKLNNRELIFYRILNETPKESFVELFPEQERTVERFKLATEATESEQDFM